MISCFLDHKQNAVAPFFDWFAREARAGEKEKEREKGLHSKRWKEKE